MSTHQTVDQFLMGSGGSYFGFPNLGDEIEGRIVEPPSLQEQKDPQTGQARKWDDGRAKMVLVVTLATNIRDADNPDDAGIRRVYIKSGMLKAVRNAVKAAGATGLEVDGRLKIRYSNNGPKPKVGFSPEKIYESHYRRPIAELPTETASGSRPTPEPNAEDFSMEAAPVGVDPTQWSRMSAEQRTSIKGALGLA